MRELKKQLVRWQDGTYDPYADNYRVLNSKKTYADWRDGQPVNDDGEVMGLPNAAEPDQLSEDDNIFGKGEAQPSAAKIILTEAKNRLTDKQALAWEFVVVQQLTEEEAAQKMGIDRSVVSRHLKAAKKKVEKYCQANEFRIQELDENI